MIDCKHIEKIYKKTDSSGRFYCLKRCVKCGQSLGMVPKPKNIDEVPILTKELEKEYQNISSNLATEKIKKEVEEKRKQFFNEYNIYLNSEGWEKKRNKVLERDKHICQACLVNKATQVHHISYQHVFDEPLFELQSICKYCHEKLHDHMKEQPKNLDAKP